MVLWEYPEIANAAQSAAMCGINEFLSSESITIRDLLTLQGMPKHNSKTHDVHL